jgi:hypothetical protein
MLMNRTDRIDTMRETATGSPVDAGRDSAGDHVSDGTTDADGIDEPVGDGAGHVDGHTDGAERGMFDPVRTDPDREDTHGTTYRRAPGMAPPPDYLEEDDADPTSGVGVTSRAEPAHLSTGSFPTIGATALDVRPGAIGVRSMDASVAIGSARVQDAVRAARVSTGPRGPRRARLSVRRLDPWSVMKFSFAVSLVLFIVMIVAASVLYLALDTMGVFTSINNTLADLVESGGADGEGFRITASGVIGTSAVLGAVNVVLFTALATLGAFIYNVCSDLVGGVEVTLAERE